MSVENKDYWLTVNAVQNTLWENNFLRTHGKQGGGSMRVRDMSGPVPPLGYLHTVPGGYRLASEVGSGAGVSVWMYVCMGENGLWL